MGDYLKYETVSNLKGCKCFSKSSEFKMNLEKGVEWKEIKAMYFSRLNADYFVGVGRTSDLHIIGFTRSSSAEKYFELFLCFIIYH